MVVQYSTGLPVVVQHSEKIPMALSMRQACPIWSRGGHLGTAYTLHVPVLDWYSSMSVGRRARRGASNCAVLW